MGAEQDSGTYYYGCGVRHSQPGWVLTGPGGRCRMKWLPAALAHAKLFVSNPVTMRTEPGVAQHVVLKLLLSPAQICELQQAQAAD